MKLIINYNRKRVWQQLRSAFRNRPDAKKRYLSWRDNAL